MRFAACSSRFSWVRADLRRIHDQCEAPLVGRQPFDRGTRGGATGKCGMPPPETSAVVHEFEGSRHNATGVNCLECHRNVEGQEPLEHRGFTIAKKVTAANCRECHATEYQQYLRSRHAVPAWASVAGSGGFTREQIAFSEQFHKGAVNASR